MNIQSAISFRDILFSYGENPILNHFTLEIPPGEFLTVIGSSGSGKTTALKLINGLLSPTKGEVWVQGQNVAHADLIQLRRSIGYVIQGVGLFPHMSIEENISYVPHLIEPDNPELKERIKELMKIVNLPEEMLTRYPANLSGGQKQRVGIARALAASPNILLMDEPFGAVDGLTRKNLQKELARIHKELSLTIFFITHDISEALTLGDRVLIINHGKIEQLGTPDEIKNHPATDFVRELIS
ncbi:MAG: ABC transporter ATP-binding protein [Negativicutes bacterium]|nr:ABC transporter ATP-binding protein [Negativicutes bacterium]